MSPPPVAERLGRLEAAGVVRGYHADIDWEAVGYGLVVYMRVICVQGFEQSTVVASLEEVPEIERVDLITGDADILVRMRLRDTKHLRECIFNDVWKVPGIDRTETFMCLATTSEKRFGPKFATALLDQLKAEEQPAASTTRA